MHKIATKLQKKNDIRKFICILQHIFRICVNFYTYYDKMCTRICEKNSNFVS